jgi:hypothetical protein
MAARNLQGNASSGYNLEETMEEAALSLFPPDVM